MYTSRDGECTLARSRTIGFTGHRIIPAKNKQGLAAHLRLELIRLITDGQYTCFITGGAVGFDTLAAQTVLGLRGPFPGIRLYVAIPCLEQDKGYTRYQKEAYSAILEAADGCFQVSRQPYFEGCMKQRNQFIVDHSGLILAYLSHGRSGTAQTVNLARLQGLPVVNLADRGKIGVQTIRS